MPNARATYLTLVTNWRVLGRVALTALILGASADSLSAPGASPSVSSLPLQKVADIPLGGRPTRFDYASLDAGRHLLFITHLGDSEVIVFNTITSRVVGRIPNIASVHGVLAVPQLGRVYATATGANEVVAIDIDTLQVTARVPTGAYPDGMAYAPEARKLYVSDKNGRTATVIDVSSNRPVASIPLGGEVGNVQYDSGSKHIFVNEQTHSELVEVDPERDRVIARIPLPGAKGNHGLLIDAARNLAFIACEDNDRLVVLDLQTRLVKVMFRTGKDPDVLAYEDGRGLLYVAGEAGVVSMYRIWHDTVSKIGDGFIGSNAHVVAVDSDTHFSYFPLRDVAGKTALRIFRSAP
jgi:YVTN family beta-propeller protein